MDIKKVLFLIGLIAPTAIYAAAPQSPLGLWKTYDLHHTPRSIVKISMQNGKLVGTIVKSLTNDVCKDCSGYWQNKSVVGMPIIWGLKKSGDTWENGYVLNVDNGKTYRCYLNVSNDNKSLYFSPYLGARWLKATITWEKVDAL